MKTIEEIMRTIRECQEEDEEKMERIRRGEGLEPLHPTPDIGEMGGGYTPRAKKPDAQEKVRSSGNVAQSEIGVKVNIEGLEELKEQTEELSDVVAAMNPQVVIKQAEGCTINIYTSLPPTTEEG